MIMLKHLDIFMKSYRQNRYLYYLNLIIRQGCKEIGVLFNLV
jgi:hypothetical protein